MSVTIAQAERLLIPRTIYDVTGAPVDTSAWTTTRRVGDRLATWDVATNARHEHRIVRIDANGVWTVEVTK